MFSDPLFLFCLAFVGVVALNAWFAARKSKIEQHKIREDLRLGHRDMLVKEAKLEIDQIRYGLKQPVVPPVVTPVPVTPAAVQAVVTSPIAAAAALPSVAVPSQEESVPVGEAMALHASGMLVIALNADCSVVVDLYPEMDQALREMTFTGSLRDLLGKSNHALDRVLNLSSLTETELTMQSQMLAVDELSALLCGEIGQDAASKHVADLRGRLAA